LRIPESDVKNLRIEHRLAGADANPYLALAAILVGLEQGLEGEREPIAPLNEDRSSGIDFPLEMLEAVKSMQSHVALREGLGAEFVDVYCENKRQDHLAFLHDISAREYRWFL
jgi:glutamine synthetase